MTSASAPQLQRSTSFGGAIILGLGSIIGTGAFVSIGLAADLAHQQLLIALLLAAAVATCNGLSSAQLAAIHPVSGGTYEYGYRFLNHDAGFSAGWLFVLAKSASAATAALAIAYIVGSWFGLSDVVIRFVAVDIVLLMTILVLTGLKRSNRVNAILVLVAVGGLLLFVWFAQQLPELARVVPLATPVVAWPDILSAAALLFVAYTGYGRIATMGEEVQDPHSTIPRAIIATVIIVTSLYAAVAWAVMQFPDILPGSADLAERARTFGGEDWLVNSITVAGMLAMAGVVLNLVLGVSRVILAMARRGDLPKGWSKLNIGRTSAPAAIWVTFLVMALFAALGDIALAWNFSAFTVLVYYGITNLAALRVPPHQRFVPQWISIIGLASCLSLALFVDPDVLVSGSGVLIVGWIWHRWRYTRGKIQ